MVGDGEVIEKLFIYVIYVPNATQTFSSKEMKKVLVKMPIVHAT